MRLPCMAVELAERSGSGFGGADPINELADECIQDGHWRGLHASKLSLWRYIVVVRQQTC
jgi:hypothetical protein